jgi:DNA-directed RNA polymerase specialized sigma subunit
MENEIYDLVLSAQNGDTESMILIINSLLPIIRKLKRKIERDRQDDLEQTIIETVIKKTLTYDITQAPDFSSFCSKLIKND